MIRSQGPETPADRQALLAAAVRRILDTGRRLLPEERAAATALLTDVYAAGLRHGISPAVWASVGSLGHECVDAIKECALQPERGRQTGSLRRHEPETGERRDRNQNGRDLW